MSARSPGWRSVWTPAVQSGSVSREAASAGTAWSSRMASSLDLERPNGEPLDHLAGRREPRAMARAVPRLLRRVPVEQAAEVRAAGVAVLRQPVRHEPIRHVRVLLDE